MLRNSGVLQFGRIIVVVGLLSILPAPAMGQIIAFDNGDPSDSDPRPETVNSAYADGWDEDDNGGYGFGPWTGLYGNPVESDVDVPQPDNNLSTPAFRLGTGGFGYGAARTIVAPIESGQSFAIDFDQFAYSFPNPLPEGYFHNDSMIRLGSTAGERFTLYNFFGKFRFGATTETYSADEWGFYAGTAFDNLNGGAPLPQDGPRWMTGYTGPDSTDGFTLRLDIVTTDTYRLTIDDDGVTKVDVSGALLGGATTGQGINNLYIWSSDGSSATIDTSYFTNMQVIETPVPPGLDGDHNEDGVVNAADYVLWRKDPVNYGGDPNGYNLWRMNFGESGSGSGGSSVPEPTSAVVMMLGAALVASMRLNRKQQ